MAAPLFRQPQASLARVNWSNALARGLTHALMPSHAGALSSLRNLADPTNNLAGSTATYRMSVGRYGQTIEKTAAAFASTHLTSKTQAAFVRGNSGIVVVASCTPSGGGTSLGLVGFQATGAGFYGDSSAILNLRISSTAVATGTTPITSAGGVWGWSSRVGGGDYHIYMDGRDDTASSSGLDLGISGGIDRVGGPYSGGAGSNPLQFALIMQWDRPLTADEHATLARNPWQLFTLSIPKRYVQTSSVATFNAAWNASANTVLTTGARAA